MFTCNICNYKTTRKSNYNRHLQTPKHKKKNKNIILLVIFI